MNISTSLVAAVAFCEARYVAWPYENDFESGIDASASESIIKDTQVNLCTFIRASLVAPENDPCTLYEVVYTDCRLSQRVPCPPIGSLLVALYGSALAFALDISSSGLPAGFSSDLFLQIQRFMALLRTSSFREAMRKRNTSAESRRRRQQLR